MNMLQRQSRIFQKNPNGNSMCCIERTYFRGGTHLVGGAIEGSDFFLKCANILGKKCVREAKWGLALFMRAPQVVLGETIATAL